MRLFLHELRAQQKLFWRSRESAVFAFVLPVAILVLAGSVYGDERINGVKASSYLVAGLIGYGTVATAFAGLAITLVIRREAGLLKRVRGTPLPASTYVAAVIASTIVVVALQVVAQVLIGRLLFDAHWPGAPGSLAVAVVLGCVVFAALGLALTALVRSAEGSSGLVSAVYLPMFFISGVFWSVKSMPSFLQAIAEVLPLTYLLRLLRSVFIDGRTLASSPGAVAVLAVWGFAGAALAVRTFRWEPRDE
jgi:ABC-2 type transport system permease protein